MHNDCMGTFDLHGLISYVSEGATSVLLYIHIVGIEDFLGPYCID